MIRKNGKDKRIRVFLSYAYPDQAHARRVRNLLALADVKVVSTDALATGRAWPSVIPGEISRCDVFIVVISPDSLESEWVLLELGAAWALKKPMIALATRPDITTIPGAPGPVEVINIEEIEKPGVLQRLLKGFLRTGANKPRETTRPKSVTGRDRKKTIRTKERV